MIVVDYLKKYRKYLRQTMLDHDPMIKVELIVR